MKNRDLVTVLSEVRDLVGLYESGAFIKKENLTAMQRKLSALNYFLTVEFDSYRRKWNAEVYNRETTANGKKESVASAETRADYKFPEKEQIRKILSAIENVSISMSQELKIMLKD
ncbi:hypothetical protein FGF1_03790 [Flavobacteriaceae bacterium GF1]